MKTSLKLASAHFKLNLPKPLLLMFLMGGLMCAPSYPRIVVVMLFIMMLGSLLGVTRETRSEEMFLTLPIKRVDNVKGQALFTAGIQLIYLLCCAVGATVALFIPFFGKTIATSQPGLVANVAFFGIALIVYGVFNLAFLPLYFKGGNATASSLFIACVVGILCAFATYGVFELLAQTVPQFGKVLLTFGADTLPWQFLILFCGAAVYAALTVWGTFFAAKRYVRGS